MTYMRRLDVVGCALLCCATWASADQPPHIVRDPMKVSPPALAWAKPDEATPIRALVICPWGNTRDVYRLAQHMNITFDLITTFNHQEVNFDATTAGRIDQPELVHTDRLLLPASKKRYDVIIVAAYSFGLLPGEVKYNIIKHAVDGAGLALFNQNMKTLGDLQKPLTAKSLGKGTELIRGIPWPAFRQARASVTTKYPGVRYSGDSVTKEMPLYGNLRNANRQVGRYRIGRGRLAVANLSRPYSRLGGVSLTPMMSYPLDKLFQYDYFLSIAAKQVRWAARGEPKVRAWSVFPNRAKMPRGPQLQEAGRVVVRSERGARGRVEIRVTVRDWDGAFEHRATHEAAIDRAEQTIGFPLPLLPDGEHFLDVQIARGDNVVDWGSAHFAVTSPVGVAKVDLQTDDDGALRDGTTIRGAVSLAGIKAPMELEVRVRDSYDRIEAVRRFPIQRGQSKQAFALDLPDRQGIIFRVAATLRADGQNVSVGRAEFTIPKHLTPDRFLAIGWAGASPQPRSIEKYRLLRQYGYETILSSFPHDFSARSTAACDIIMVPYMIRLMSCDAKTCFTTAEWYKQMSAGLEAHARMISKYGALGYSLGDEVRLQSYVCNRPDCVAKFQQWLEGTYKTVDALNAEWQTKFKAFDEIEPTFIGEAKRKRNYVPTMDYLQHRRDLWVEQCRFCYDAIQRGHPGARMGYEGASGYERWPELLEFFRLTGPYTRYDMDTALDLARPDTVIGNWMGSYGGFGRDIPRERHARWYSLQRLIFGFNSQWWWTTAMAFKGDNTPVERMDNNAQTLALIQAGLGKVLVTSDFQRDPVVIPYSPPSDLATQFYSELTSIDTAKTLTREILKEHGLRQRRVPMTQIAAGELERLGTKVVMLPYHQAMSKREAEGLRRFVARGGTLIADLRPAVLDEHGKPLETGFLDATFGIARKSIEPPHTATGKPDMSGARGPFAALAKLDAELRADKSVTARADAKAHGTIDGVPICIENRVGKGRAILLNFALNEYSDLRTADEHRPLQRMLARLLEEAGLPPEVRVTVDGQPADRLDIPRWRKGDMLIVGLDRYPVDPARDRPWHAKLQWRKRGHVYEILSNTYFGETDSAETELSPHEVKFFAWLPHQIGDVSLNVPATVRAGERVPITVGLDVPVGGRALHVVGIDVYRPDGTWAHYLRKRIALKDARAQAHVRLAHNAPVGTWKLRAREVISGKTVERAFRVTPSALARKGGE